MNANGRRLLFYTTVIFAVMVPVAALMLNFVRTSSSWLSGLLAYSSVFPGWFLALWVFGYSSGPSASLNIFIVVVNAVLYTAIVALVVFIKLSADSAKKSKAMAEHKSP